MFSGWNVCLIKANSKDFFDEEKVIHTNKCLDQPVYTCGVIMVFAVCVLTVLALTQLDYTCSLIC